MNEELLSYGKTHDLCMKILSALGEETFEYGMAGCALAIGRLSKAGEPNLLPDEEIKFVQDMLDWVAAYWGAGEGTIH